MDIIKILLVDDHRFFRLGLRQVCEAQPGFEVVGEAENGEQAVVLANELKPAIILMDIEMPVMDGVRAAAQIYTDGLPCRVIMLTAYQKEEYLFNAIQAGAVGYLLKDANEADLISVIRSVYSGQVVIDAGLAARMIAEFRRMGAWGQSARGSANLKQIFSQEKSGEIIERLTEGEMDVLRMVAQGYDNHAIAVNLSLSEKTVTNRLTSIYQKLQVNSRVQATLFALRKGWVNLDTRE